MCIKALHDGALTRVVRAYQDRPNRLQRNGSGRVCAGEQVALSEKIGTLAAHGTGRNWHKALRSWYQGDTE
jgi:hypothetical protein